MVSRFQAEREVAVWGLVVWELAEMHIHQPKQRRPEKLTVLELHPQRWQHGRAFDGSDANGGAYRLRWQSRLVLAGCRRR
jgi:hypothetical protein